jgi:hypothetical protein
MGGKKGLIYKEDWQEAAARCEAWWHGEIVDRAVIQVVAPRPAAGPDYRYLAAPGGTVTDAQALLRWFTDPDLVIPRLEKLAAWTYWGGEAMPTVMPVNVRMVAITAAYLGAPYRLVPGSDSAWAGPIIEDWATRPRLAFDPANEWWQMSKRLLDEGARRAPGRYYVGVPDLNSPTEIVALLRGTERLLVDLLECPEEVKRAVDEANAAWLRAWEASIGVIHQWVGGYFYWINIWSDRPSIDLQCDVSCMVSPTLFEEVFLPAIEQQTRWIERTVYHLDGPNAIRHLDALLALPRLRGIQWVPGDGAAPMSKWIPLLRRIQAKGKLLVLSCEPWEVETLLTELEPEGVCLQTSCPTQEMAEELLGRVPKWTARRRWVLP